MNILKKFLISLLIFQQGAYVVLYADDVQLAPLAVSPEQLLVEQLAPASSGEILQEVVVPVSSRNKNEIISGTILSWIVNTGSVQIPSSPQDIKNQKMLSEIEQVRAKFDTLTGDALDQEIYESTNTSSETFDVEEALKQVKNLKQGMEEIVKEVMQIDGEKMGIDKQYGQTRDEVKKVVQQMSDATDNVSTSLRRINIYKKQITESADDIKTIRATMQQVKDYLVKFTSFLYKIHNDYYTANEQIDEIKLFIKSENIADTLSNEYIVQAMMKKFDELLQQLELDQQKQIELLKKMNALKIKNKYEILNYQSQLNSLAQKKVYLTEFLKLYRSDKIKIQWDLKNLFDSRKDVENSVQKISQKLAEKEIPSDIGFDLLEKMDVLNTLKEKDPSSTFLSWPILPVSTLNYLFKDSTFLQKNWYESHGIEIPVEQGTPIYAPANAVVYQVFDRDGLALNWIVLAHKYELMSVFMYVNKALVKAGDVVSRGQLIGYSGGEPGTKGAGFISRGPNATFQVLRKGKFIDPLALLDLSVMKDKSQLTESLQVKFIKNKYARSIDLSDLKFMQGENLLQRRIAFLELYGKGIFRDVAFWEDASEGTNIDVDMGICISFAESTMGRYLASSNNIGNVGNNDRGDRVPFGSILWGARAIYQTLNNTYLGSYSTINKLSGRWNQEGKVYASSKFNWQNNVQRCLSMIKWYLVPEEYPFRTGLNPMSQASYDVPGGVWETFRK